MRYTIYVDSLYGSDTNTGELSSPVATLPYALSQVYEGGVIVLQTGTGLSYGNLTVIKNVTIKAAYGATPIAGIFTLSGVQGLVEGLTFSNTVSGITASNLNTGSIIIRGCYFRSVETAINIDSVNYVSIHRNYFYDYDSAIRVNSSEEVCASSNIFSNGKRAIDIVTVNRLDLWKNTIYGAIDLPPVLNPDTNLRIIYKTLTSFDIQYKRLQLPGFASEISGGGAYDVAFNVVNGPSFNYGTDFTVILSGSLVSWDGLQLENEFAAGDVVRVMYSETGDIDPGNAISLQNIGDENSRVDSNSISAASTQIATGVYFNTPVKILNNNFDDVLVWWNGAIPTGSTGMNNIGETAMYRDPFNEDFRLQPSSPNIGKADYDRWNNIYGEIGVVKTPAGYTSSYTGIRDHISPFDRDIDYDLFHRGATGIQGLTGDIGALEFNYNETAMGDHVAEFGYDMSYPGTETGPYATPDRGYRRSGANDLYVATNVVPSQDGETGPYTFYTTGSSYSRFRSKEIILSDSDLVVGTRTRNDVVVIYPSHPSLGTDLIYVSPDGSDTGMADGTLGSPYRTIGKALQIPGSQYILVEPGYYPSFKGVTGIHLVGVERYTGMELNGILYTNIRDSSWTGIGTYDYDKDTMTLTSPSNVVGSLFSFDSDVDLKLFATVKSDNLIVKLSNVDNSVYIKLNRYLSVITYGYITNGSTYEINTALPGPYTPDELFTDLKVRFLIKNNRFSISVDGMYVHGSYANNFTAGVFTNWIPQFINTGSGDDTVSNLKAFSSSITGATGVNSVITLKKLFAITGATGIQD